LPAARRQPAPASTSPISCRESGDQCAALRKQQPVFPYAELRRLRDDDWRVNQKFSHNFGFRWDYGTPISELYNRMANLAIAPGYSGIATLLAGQNGTPTSLVQRIRTTSRRVLVFRGGPIAKKSMVIARLRDLLQHGGIHQIANNMAQQPPFAIRSVSRAIRESAHDRERIAHSGEPGADQHLCGVLELRIGYAQIWQMSIQNDLDITWSTLTYNGTKGTALDQTILPNSAPPGGQGQRSALGIHYESANGNSIYHSATFN